jgi:hypothetical protein
MNRYLVLISSIVIAFVLLRYRSQIRNYIGDVGFAEKYLGAGGTYKLIAILAILSFVIGLMYFFGTFQALLGDYLGPLFGA